MELFAAAVIDSSMSFRAAPEAFVIFYCEILKLCTASDDITPIFYPHSNKFPEIESRSPL